MPPQPPPLTLSVPKKNPKIIGRFKQKPKKVHPKFLVKKRGGGKGYVTIANPNYKAPVPAAPGPPPGPYDQYPDWAKQQLLQMDRDQAFHQSYVTDKIIPGATAGLTALNQFATNAADQYTNQLQGAAQGAYNVSAGATPLATSGGPGGIVASPNAYQTAAGSDLARSLGSAATAMGQHQAMLSKVSPAIAGKGILGNLAEYAKGLPLQYTTKRDQRMGEIDQFLQEMAQAQSDYEEKVRHNKVQEAISATNAESNAAIAFGRLGLDSSKEGYDQTRDTIAASSAPYGYLPNPSGGSPLRDPSVPQATAPSSGSGGGGSTSEKYSPQWMAEKNFVGGWKAKPKKLPAWAKSGFTQGTDGKWYVKRGGTASGGKTSSKVLAGSDLQKKLVALYKPGGTGGWEERYLDNPKGAGTEMARWVRENKVSFSKGGKVDVAKLKQVLARIGGRPAAEALSILTRGYITADGRWK